MNRRSLTVLMLVGALLCGGCGGGRLSAAAFQAKANGICRQIHRKTMSINSPTSQSFNRGLRAVDTGLRQLRQLRPPAADVAAYSAFVDRLSRTFARVRKDGPRLLVLEHELTSALPKHVSVYGPSPFRSSRYQTLLRHENRLVRPLLLEARAAARDARALGLEQCANGLA